MGSAFTRASDPSNARKKQPRFRTPTKVIVNTPSPTLQLVFGRPLRDLVEEEKSRGPFIVGQIRSTLPDGVDPQSIPSILLHTIQSMRELEALEVEGIFRVPGSFMQFEKLRNQINSGNGKNINFGSLDVHILATLVKQFIATLPDPITTVQLYEHWISAARYADSSERMRALIEVYRCMPEPNKSCMKFLFEFLADIHRKRDVNKMGAPVLATAFGPSVLRDDGKNPAKMFLDMRDVHVAVSTMIEFFNEVFNSSNGPVQDQDCEISQEFEDPSPQNEEETFDENNAGFGEEDADAAALPDPNSREDAADNTEEEPSQSEEEMAAFLEMQRKIALLPPPPPRRPTIDMLRQVQENEQQSENDGDDEEWT